jgi:hypothetical protein
MDFWSRRYARQNAFQGGPLNIVEQVYIVWSGGNCTPRLRSPTYRICGVVLLGYVAVLVLMIIGQISALRADGICVIGLKDFAYVPSSCVITHISHIATGPLPL